MPHLYQGFRISIPSTQGVLTERKPMTVVELTCQAEPQQELDLMILVAPFLLPVIYDLCERKRNSQEKALQSCSDAS